MSWCWHHVLKDQRYSCHPCSCVSSMICYTTIANNPICQGLPRKDGLLFPTYITHEYWVTAVLLPIIFYQIPSRWSTVFNITVLMDKQKDGMHWLRILHRGTYLTPGHISVFKTCSFMSPINGMCVFLPQRQPPSSHHTG